MANEINWAAPVVGKLEAGKSFIDRSGQKHTLSSMHASPSHRWFETGQFSANSDYRHVLDLIAEYTPPAPLKMWMNVYATGSLQLFSSRRNAQDASDDLGKSARIAVPVTITEGH